jgi:heme/copper-type cytochrome/quinol oxidase subunit 1
VEAVSVSVANELTDSEQEDLLRLFHEDFIQAPDGQRLSPEWVTWLMIAKDAGTVLAAANAAVTFAKHIVDWRKKVVERGRRPAVHLTADGGDTLDLTQASDEEIEQWFRWKSRNSEDLE